MKGRHRCYMHGGYSPATLMMARESMALLRMPGIEALFNVLETLTQVIDHFKTNTCPTCGYPSGDVHEIEAIARVSAVIVKHAQTVLDRTDVGPKATLEVKQSDGDLDLAALTDIERSRMMNALTEYEAIKAAIRERLRGGPLTIM